MKITLWLGGHHSIKGSQALGKLRTTGSSNFKKLPISNPQKHVQISNIKWSQKCWECTCECMHVCVPMHVCVSMHVCVHECVFSNNESKTRSWVWEGILSTGGVGRGQGAERCKYTTRIWYAQEKNMFSYKQKGQGHEPKACWFSWSLLNSHV